MTRPLVPPVLAALFLLACEATVGSLPARPGHTEELGPAPRTPLRRLTAWEYGNTVSDVFAHPAAWGEALPTEGSDNGFDNDATSQSETFDTVDRLADAAMFAASELAPEVSARLACGDPGPCAAARNTRMFDAFVDRYGRLLYRRPLDEQERARAESLYDDVVAMWDGDHQRGVEALIGSMLQSPQFLYRVEVGVPESERDGVVELEPYELATRLAFFLTGAGPDRELLDAAEVDALRSEEELDAQVARLLASPGGHRSIDHFTEQWLHLGVLELASPDAERFPNWTDAAGTAMHDSITRFFADVVASGAPDAMRTLYTTRTVYVNATLAPFYGLAEGDYGAELVPVEITGEPRAGLMTNAGLMTAGATALDSHPIKRGLFFWERFLCRTPPPPPDDLVINIPESDPNLTTRQRWEQHEATGTSCYTCHTFIDPPGFVLEAYDAIGRYRERENGIPIDTTVELRSGLLDGAYANAPALADALADAYESSECMTRWWFTYANGRPAVDYDRPSVEKIARVLHEGGALRDAIGALVRSRAFATRPRSTPERCSQ